MILRSYIQHVKLTCVFLILVLICGCWDIKEIENINYVTAIGIDYTDQQFVLYAQMLDFSAVAKTESAKSDKRSQVWIGKAKGKTLNLAMNDLYATAQERTSWSHVSSIIVSERALESGILKTDDLIGRYWEIRLTPWIFGTKEKIEQLLAIQAFFNLSQRNTLSHEPIETYDQRSYLVPIRFLKFMSQSSEPGTTVLLPSLAINSTTWTKNEKKDSKMFVDGAFVLSDGKLRGLLNNQKILGLRWVERKTWRSPVAITIHGKDAAVVSLGHPRVRKYVTLSNGKPKYHLHIKLSGNVTEILREISRREIEEKAAEVVRNEILNTYRNGLKINADLFSLEHLLFKHHTRTWKEIKRSGLHMIDENSIPTVKVEIKLDHVGMKTFPLK